MDLRGVSSIDFYKQHTFYDDTVYDEDIKMIKLIWSLDQFRKIDKALRRKGIQTLTRIDDRPSEGNQYYVIGYYQLPTPDHLTRMSYYRVDLSNKTVEYQSLDDFVNDKWRKVE
jgi:hypothetical protein